VWWRARTATLAIAVLAAVGVGGCRLVAPTPTTLPTAPPATRETTAVPISATPEPAATPIAATVGPTATFLPALTQPTVTPVPASPVPPPTPSVPPLVCPPCEACPDCPPPPSGYYPAGYTCVKNYEEIAWEPWGYEESPDALVYIYSETRTENYSCICDLILLCSYEPIGGGPPPPPEVPTGEFGRWLEAHPEVAARLGMAVGPVEVTRIAIAELSASWEPGGFGNGGLAIRRLDRPQIYLLYHPWFWPRNPHQTEQRWQALIGEAFPTVREGTERVLPAVIQRFGRGVRINEHLLYEDDATWTAAPRPSWIAFVSDRDGNEEIYVMPVDGGPALRLTDHPARDNQPAWSPDGTRIAFVSDRDGNSEIYVMNADGSDPVNLTRNPATDTAPSWSPDGTRILFTSDRDGGGPSNEAIYVMNADGTGVRRLTYDSYIDSSASWVDDRIAFHSYRAGNADIYLMNPDGSGRCQVTHDLTDESSPVWSPLQDEQAGAHLLAFVSNRDGEDPWSTDYNIWVMTPACEGPLSMWRLTEDPAIDLHPTWSPDGTRIAFSSNRDGDWEIYVVNADGTGLVKLTDNSAYDSEPSWH